MSAYENETCHSATLPVNETEKFSREISYADDCLREQVMERGKLLLDDPDYPGEDVICSLADLFVEIL